MSHPQKPPQPTVQTVRSAQSLAGCFYQVVQAPGPQGTNVLNLLPLLKPKDKPLPAAPPAPAPSVPALHVPPAVVSPPVPVLSRPSPVSVPLLHSPTLRNYIYSAQNNTLHIENQFPVFQEATLFLDRGQLALPANSVPGNPPTFIMVNTKPASPVKPMPPLPSGHSLQIPPHAEVMSLPVSSLPVSIQQKILPQMSGSNVGKVPSVIYVSPVNTVKTPSSQSNPSPDTKSLSQTRPPSGGSSETPVAPMKWVVQQNHESACLVPVKSSNDTASKILQMLTKTKMEDVTVTNPDPSKVVQIKDNALVMCNNKIFFLTKKGTEIINAGVKVPEPPQFLTPEKPAAKMKPTSELSNKVVQVVLAKNKSPPPSAEVSVQCNVVSTAKPKRKSTTPRAIRGDLSSLYMPESSGSNVSPRGIPSSAAGTSAESAANKGDPVRTPDPTIRPDPAREPDPVRTPDLAKKPDPGRTPVLAKKPDPDRTPDLAKKPDPERTPDPARKPDLAKKPDPGRTPVLAKKPDPERTPDLAKKPDPDRTPDLAKKPDPERTPDPARKPDLAKKPDPGRTPVLAKKPDPERTPDLARKPDPVRTPDPARKPDPERTPVLAKKPDPERTPVLAKKPDPVRTPDQPLPKPQRAEIATSLKIPEVKDMEDRSWKLKFGLTKMEKIILRRIPLIRAAGPPGKAGSTVMDPVETKQNPLKRKLSQSENITKMQKRWESDRDVSQNSLETDVSANPSSPEPRETTHGSHDPPDTADFQADQDSAGHFSHFSLSSPRFHIGSMYSDETTSDEKIQRLKQVLKERENALEALRRQKI